MTILKPTPVIPLERVEHPLFRKQNIRLDMLRIDKTDPLISGNKWFKLKYNLAEAKKQKHHTLLSFGGPYSNHLHALASAATQYNFNSIGIIRGEQQLPLNPTLADVTAQGMKLYYIDRKSYRNKHQPDTISRIKAEIENNDPFNIGSLAGQFYLLPEGGTNSLAVTGAAEIVRFIPDTTDYVCVSCGTGGTMAGIISGLSHRHNSHCKVLGFPAMKGGQFLQAFIEQLLSRQNLSSNTIPWQLFYQWSFGGFGKLNRQLAVFLDDFEQKYQIDLDPIYTAKMMYAIVSMAEANFFSPGSRIVAIHTGGLQGRRGMHNKLQGLLTKSD